MTNSTPFVVLVQPWKQIKSDGGYSPKGVTIHHSYTDLQFFSTQPYFTLDGQPFLAYVEKEIFELIDGSSGLIASDAKAEVFAKL